MPTGKPKRKSLQGKVKMNQQTAEAQGLESVFPVGHKYGERIFYDPKEGKYYDAASDVYLSQDQLPAFGLGAKALTPKQRITSKRQSMSKKAITRPSGTEMQDTRDEAEEQKKRAGYAARRAEVEGKSLSWTKDGRLWEADPGEDSLAHIMEIRELIRGAGAGQFVLSDMGKVLGRFDSLDEAKQEAERYVRSVGTVSGKSIIIAHHKSLKNPKIGKSRLGSLYGKALPIGGTRDEWDRVHNVPGKPKPTPEPKPEPKKT